MSTLLAGRLLTLQNSRFTIRQATKIFVVPYFLQHSYAAARTSTPPNIPFVCPKVIPVFRRAALHPDRIAIADAYGDYTYKGIFRSSRLLAADISSIFKGAQLERIAFLCPSNASYVITQWACWMSGQIAVPLSSLHPPALLEHYVTDSNANLLITTAEYAEVMKELSTKTGRKLLILEDSLRKAAMKPEETVDSQMLSEVEVVEDPEDFEAGMEPAFYNDRKEAMIVYTSGTTGPPKGAVLTHLNLMTQADVMTKAWEWTSKDIVLHALPLHHVHGTVNALLTPLSVGARCLMLEKFDAAQVWTSLLAIRTKQSDRPNMFMGVPTMYSLLIEEFDKIFANNPRMKEYVLAVCSEKIRLMTSGSARLQPSVHERWQDITGHKVLERYGMTETGMILSNPLKGVRKPGFVGTPMPTVEVRVVEQGPSHEVLVEGNEAGSKVLGKTTFGELEVRGPSVFKGYYMRPKTTQREFTNDGWFKTGDTVQYVDGSYQVLGRSSVDIIKTGGYKVSALEVEAKMITHPDIVDCAVVGLSDVTWGHKVAVIVVSREGSVIDLPSLREWSKEHLASYAVPTMLKVVAEIPKNAMGKINKKQLLVDLFPEAVVV